MKSEEQTIDNAMADIEKAMSNITDKRNYIQRCTFCGQCAIKVKTDCAITYFYTKDIDTIQLYDYNIFFEIVINTIGTHNTYTFVKNDTDKED